MHRSGSRSAFERAPASFSFTTTVSAAAAAASVLLLAMLPEPLVMPAIAILLVGAGMTIAAGLHAAGYRLSADDHHAWDVAGLMVFVGFAAAIMTDSASALATLDQIAAAYAIDK
jgi:hypothetical protein